MTPAWTRAVLLLGVTFALGGATGFAIGRSSTAPRMPAAANPMEPHAFVQRLGRDLDLDAKQRDGILAILTRRQTTIDSAWRSLQPSVRATIDSARAEIVELLRPGQRDRYFALERAAHGGM
jgi:hypothetical protein